MWKLNHPNDDSEKIEWLIRKDNIFAVMFEKKIKQKKQVVSSFEHDECRWCNISLSFFRRVKILPYTVKPKLFLVGKISNNVTFLKTTYFHNKKYSTDDTYIDRIDIRCFSNWWSINFFFLPEHSKNRQKRRFFVLLPQIWGKT